MRVRALLGAAGLGLTLLAGEAALDRPLRGVMTTDLRDPGRYLSGGELVLTGLAWWRGPADAEPFVRVLTRAGVAALAAGTAEFGEVPPALTEVCAAYRLPLFAVAEEVSFATITEHVTRRLSAARAGDLAAVVERHRRLVAAGLPGGGPGAVLGLLGSDLDLAAWVVSAAGALVADSGCGPLPETTAARRPGTRRRRRPGARRRSTSWRARAGRTRCSPSAAARRGPWWCGPTPGSGTDRAAS